MKLDDIALAGIPRIKGDVLGATQYPVAEEGDITLDGKVYRVFVAGIDARINAIGVCCNRDSDERRTITPTFFWLRDVSGYSTTRRYSRIPYSRRSTDV
jgi:hypothetical protein